MKIQFRDLIELLFLPVLTAGVFVLWDVNKTINVLNVQVGILIERNSSNKDQIDFIKVDVEKIKDKLKSNGQ